MNAENRLQAIKVTNNILINGSTKQVELFTFYTNLGVKALQEMSLKEAQLKQEVEKRNAEALKKAKQKEEAKELEKEKAKLVKKPQDRKPKVVKSIKKTDIKVS